MTLVSMWRRRHALGLTSSSSDTFSAPSIFSLIRIWGQPGLGSERPALFCSLQSQGRGKSPGTKRWGLLGAQVTLIYKMSLFKSQVQISLLVFFQGVEEGAVISYQWPLRTLPPVPGIKGMFPLWLWHQTELEMNTNTASFQHRDMFSS